jgi:hypothetical protein
MVKTQVQIPDHLYHETKRIARDYEMSFAEVVRRGLEQVAVKYPPRVEPVVEWKVPVTRPMGCNNLTPEQLKDAAQMPEFEAQMERLAKRKKRR